MSEPAATATTTVHLLRHGEVHNPERRALRPAAGLPPLRPRPRDGRPGRRAPRATATSPTSCPHRWSGRRRPRRLAAALLGLEVATDDRLIEAANVFEGKTFGVGDGSLRKPKHWVHLRNPFRPSWGEPYVEIAVRMLAAIDAARDAARGHEALCVSHQLPIWIARSLRRAAAGCGTTRASGSARSRPSPRSPSRATTW